MSKNIIIRQAYCSLKTSAKSNLRVETTGCAICGSHDAKILFHENEAQIHQIVKCCECGLMYAYPLKRTNFERYANDSVNQDLLTDDHPDVKRALIKINDYKKIAEVLSSIGLSHGKLLEIGAYTGILLNFFKDRGWEVEGLEPDQRAIVYAREKFRLELIPKTLEHAEFEQEIYAAVIMLHVIEHLDNPAESLSIIHRILKVKGVLVLETPTYDTIMFRLLGRRERSISCNGHTFFFTQENLRKLLQNEGFKIISQKKVGRTLSIGRLLWNVGVMSKSARLSEVLKRYSGLLNLDKRRIFINVGDMQRVYCEKV